ncbi:hypothetical protein FPRO05_00857 [Fusarium proliferatum]|uniref:Uncharacterized protein n=1 Tax=Gibberella intermedia TaxID=948311 RepID=A0A365NNT4_GIBIN|nr:hypothetical protein FPRO05_00857 [Fusarium proliferatum]
MASSLLLKTASPYREFTERPIIRFNCHGAPFDVPVTITDRDGTLIHEQEGQGLLYTIITHNDVEFLEKYFAIDPRAIPNLFELPDGDEAICDFGDWFRFAAESGSLGTLQTLLAYTTKGLDETKPIRLMRANFQLLNVAAQFGHIEILPSVLTLAAQWASSNLLERLIDGGADVHYKVAVGSWDLGFGSQRDLPVKIEVTELFLASFRANPNGVKTLVDRRSDGVSIADMVCSPDCVGSLPLHWAARNQLPDLPGAIPLSMLHDRAGKIYRTIRQLLEFVPTTVNIQDNDGNTTLHYAAEFFGKNGQIYTPVFELLCSQGADASLRNHKDQTPLHTLFYACNDDTPIDPVLISLLLAHGAKATDIDDAGNTPLQIARLGVRTGSDAFSLLLQHGTGPVLQSCEQRNVCP